jgi:hypothetical protein
VELNLRSLMLRAVFSWKKILAFLTHRSST